MRRQLFADQDTNEQQLPYDLNELIENQPLVTKRKFSQIIIQNHKFNSKGSLMAAIINTRRHGQQKFNSFRKL